MSATTRPASVVNLVATSSPRFFFDTGKAHRVRNAGGVLCILGRAAEDSKPLIRFAPELGNGGAHCYKTVAIRGYLRASVLATSIGGISMRHVFNCLSTLALAAGATAFFAVATGSAQTVLVTNGKDSGEGSLRAALEAVARDETPGQILVVTEGDIEIGSTLVYWGKAPLSVHGNGQTVKTDADTTLLTASEGADLTVSDLNFEGPGGFDVENRGDAGKGIFIDVREDQTGVVTLVLNDVKVSGVAYHGVHVSDCNLADECGAGRGGAGEGSDSSIVVRLTDVEISDVGNGRFDADGIRVDERGAGNILFYADDSSFTNVGADGVELDEGQEGGVFATAVDAKFDDNGNYCDPKVFKAHLPEKDEGAFVDGEAKEADIPAAVTGSPDDACIEREVELYGSGSVKSYEFEIDLDDGFDIDEAGPGDLWVLIVDSTVQGNRDEGLDFGEEDEGGVKLAVWRTSMKDNTDDGLKMVESEPGDLNALLHEVTAKDNGGFGAVFKQKDEGNLDLIVDRTKTSNNADGDDTGLEVLQEGEGEGTLTLRASEIEDGITSENVTINE